MRLVTGDLEAASLSPVNMLDIYPLLRLKHLPLQRGRCPLGKRMPGLILLLMQNEKLILLNQLIKLTSYPAHGDDVCIMPAKMVK